MLKIDSYLRCSSLRLRFKVFIVLVFVNELFNDFRVELIWTGIFVYDY